MRAGGKSSGADRVGTVPVPGLEMSFDGWRVLEIEPSPVGGDDLEPALSGREMLTNHT